MRDVIVIGAGGGGPVVAKELAARGLDASAAHGALRGQFSCVSTRFTAANLPA